MTTNPDIGSAKAPRDELPTGTVTFMFNDIEGSTNLVNSLGERFDRLLGRHHEIIRAALAAERGVEVSTEGDAFFAVFPSAPRGLAAALTAQRTFAAESWPPDGAIRVQMGLHTRTGAFPIVVEVVESIPGTTLGKAPLVRRATANRVASAPGSAAAGHHDGSPSNGAEAATSGTAASRAVR